MIEILRQALNPVLIIFVVSSMFNCGLVLKPKQIFEPFCNVRKAISAIAGNYILVPLISIFVSELLRLDEPLSYGLFLLSISAGAEPSPKYTAIAKGDVGLSTGMLVISLIITIFCIPLVFSLKMAETQMHWHDMMMRPLFTVALPVASGLILKYRFENFTEHVLKYIQIVSGTFLFILLIIIVIINYKLATVMIGSGAILAAMIFIVASFVTGYLLGSPKRSEQLAMAFTHGARNGGIALLIARQAFPDQPKVEAMITLTVLLMLVTLLPASLVIGYYNK